MLFPRLLGREHLQIFRKKVPKLSVGCVVIYEDISYYPFKYLRQFEQLSVWMMLMEKSMSITTEKTEELKNASKAGELNEEQIRGYFKCNAAEPKEKAPKKQSVKFAFDEISDFFPDMKPKEVKDKIIEILFAWYDASRYRRTAKIDISTLV